MRVVVLADTHAPRRWRTCPPRVAVLLRGADMILHAGDVCTAEVLDELAEYAPVVAVAGNNDGPDVAAWGAGPTAELDIGGLAVAMVHDSGPATGRLVRMRRQFPRAELVVFGHSHIPLDVSGDGFRIFNPGSPTDRRRQPAGTAGVLDVQDGLLVSASIVPVTLPRGRAEPPAWQVPGVPVGANGQSRTRSRTDVSVHIPVSAALRLPVGANTQSQ